MIQKISPAISITKVSARSILKSTDSKLKYLAGSSRSGYNPPTFHEVEMVIPGGLDFKEKAYYLLKGKLPNSVYERWFPNDGEHIVDSADQLVTVERTYRGLIGNIVEAPHGANSVSVDVSNHGMLNDITGGDTISTGLTDSSGDNDIGIVDIFKHLVGIN